MFLALWEYEVKSGCEERFESAYGPGSDWARLFRSDSNYRATRLLGDPFRPAIYLTLDFWNWAVSCQLRVAALCLPSHMAMNPSGSRSGCRNLRGVPAERSRASAAK